MCNLMIHMIFYTHSIRPLKEENIVTDGHIKFAYNMNIKEFVDTFNTNKTVREEAIFYKC
ncbi:Uncharacterised protein [Serratia fonticola]|uniref:Uncharacterized protein n=1 Tax=Serratia fonticola TaxID=47917 RepID=A0A4U9W3S3_SERFO|nr:Uncharacterised protein [Serratia fonticola]